MREGMSWIVPVPLLSLLTAKQLEQMVCGMPEICCDVLKKVVRYREVDEQHSLVQWFWQTLEEFSNEERVLFMRFVSGRSRLPANTADISQRFQIMKVDRVSASRRVASEPEPETRRLTAVPVARSPTTACPRRRPASSSCACRRTPARPSWPRGCATPSTTAAPSTWTTTCCPATWTTPRARTPTTDPPATFHFRFMILKQQLFVSSCGLLVVLMTQSVDSCSTSHFQGFCMELTFVEGRLYML